MINVIRKINSQKGESIAETLIALMISVFGITLLAVMIQASSRLILSSNEKIEKYVENEVVYIEKSNFEGSPVGEVSLTDSDDNPVRLTKDSSPYIDIYYFEKELGNKKIVAYKKK